MSDFNFKPVELGVLEAVDTETWGEISQEEFLALGWTLAEVNDVCDGVGFTVLRGLNADGITVLTPTAMLLDRWERWERFDRQQAAHEARMGY